MEVPIEPQSGFVRKGRTKPDVFEASQMVEADGGGVKTGHGIRITKSDLPIQDPVPTMETR